MRFTLVLCLLLSAQAWADESFLYWSKCKNAYAVDGDTIDCEFVALPFNIALRDQRFRLAYINAPESRGPKKEPAGVAAKEWLGKVVNGKDIYVATVPDKEGESEKGSFGRWLGVFYMTPRDVLFDTSVNDVLVAEGHAVYRDY